MVAVKAAGDLLVERGTGQEVAGELFDGEFVEREVAVVGIDDPVAPAGHVTAGVDVITVRVGEPGGVEPVEGHALAVTGGVEESVHEPLIGVGPAVGEEGVDFGRGRRQAGQVEGRAADQRGAVGLG